MKHKTTSAARKIFFIGLIANIALGAAYVVLLRVVRANLAKETSIRSEISTLELQNAQLVEAKAALLEAAPLSEKTGTYGVGEVESQVQFLSSLEELARSQGVTLEIKNPSITEGERALFSMSLISAGSWQNLTNFFALLETLPMRVTLSNLKLTSKSPGGVWEGELNLQVLKLRN